MDFMRSFQIIALTCGLLSSTCDAVAQEATPLAQPDLDLLQNGDVHAAVRQPDGSIVVGGNFSRIGGVARANIARLNPDGSVDLNWSPSVPAFVTALAIDGAGNIYAANGDEADASGPTVIKLDGHSGNELTPQYGIDFSYIRALAVDSSGDLFVAGDPDLRLAGTTQYVDVVKVSNGVVDRTWNPGIQNYYVHTLAVDPQTNSLFVGASGHVVKAAVAGTGAVDPTWTTTVDGGVSALALDGNGDLFIGGGFTHANGQERDYLAKVSSSGAGALDTNWNPSADSNVLAMILDGKGNLYVTGYFANIGGSRRAGLAEISVTGTGIVNPNWHPTIDDPVNNGGPYLHGLVLNNAGNLFLTGLFTTISGQTRRSVAMISADGSVGSAIDAVLPGAVNALAVQSDGSVIVGGSFFGTATQTRNNLLRLQTDGAIDPNWNPSPDSTSGYGARALAVDGKDSVYVGGDFSHIGGQPRQSVAKLSGSGNGAADLAWGAANDGTLGIWALALDAAANAYVIGDFTTMGGYARANGLAKISASGTVDANWSPVLPASVSAAQPVLTALATDGTFVYVGGETLFSTGNSSLDVLNRFAADGSGTIDPTWNPAPTTSGAPPSGPYYYGVTSLALDGQGNLFVGGDFRQIAGTSVMSGIAKLATSGAAIADPLWTKIQGIPAATALSTDAHGNLYVAGVSPFGIKRSPADPYAYFVQAFNGQGQNLGVTAWTTGSIASVIGTVNGATYAGGSFDAVIGPDASGQLSLSSRSGLTAFSAGDLAPPEIELDQRGLTGAWYNPLTSGQGFLIQSFPDVAGPGQGVLFAGWFTYDVAPAGDATEQRWYTLQGGITKGNPAAALNIYAATGGNFNAPPKVSSGIVGQAALSFTDCAHGTLTYAFSDGSGRAGIIPLTRLTANPYCGSNGDNGAAPGNALLSGAWYDPNTSGQGLLFSVSPQQNLFFGAWYTYALNGQVIGGPQSQRWYTIQGNLPVGGIVAQQALTNLPIYTSVGGVFDESAPTATQRVGTADIVFQNCQSATLAYSFSAGTNAGLSGSIALTNLASVLGGCGL